MSSSGALRTLPTVPTCVPSLENTGTPASSTSKEMGWPSSTGTKDSRDPRGFPRAPRVTRRYAAAAGARRTWA